ncbi:MAG: CBS domain-containing protein [Woeseiaceae bacterium]|nr:CBS domain-containing protein [Woeseiaceae bacterium]
MMSLDMIMSTDLVTVAPDDTLASVNALMHKNRIHHLPVVEQEDQLVGLVTLTDVLAATDSILRDEESRLQAEQIKVSDFMKRDLATIDERASLRQAALFIEKHKIGCLPVVSDGKLIGIVTDTDFVGVAINLLEQIEETESFDEAI